MRITGRWIVAILTLALALPTAAVGQEEGPRGRRPGAEMLQRRAELERQVRQRFLTQVSDRLELTTEQRARLRVVLEEGAESRHALAQESRTLRRELIEAVRDDDTPLSTYDRLLARIRQLREREQALEDREAAALAEFLDARQQAVFLMLRMQLNERVRRMQGGVGRGPAGAGAGGLF